MLRVGLTGGIGCGKSAVATMMRDLGCFVLDADALARQLEEPGQPAYQDIVLEFGSSILGADQRIDRQHLARVVFQDVSRLARLNQIVHPRVIAAQEKWLADLATREPHGVAVVEAALLIEAGAHKHLDRVIVVSCRPEQQVHRLTSPAARGMSREDAAARIASQMALEEKRRLATDHIDNSGTLEETRRQVEALVAKLKLLAASQQSHS
jgi:dephospho-CoA kinase